MYLENLKIVSKTLSFWTTSCSSFNTRNLFFVSMANLMLNKLSTTLTTSNQDDDNDTNNNLNEINSSRLLANTFFAIFISNKILSYFFVLNLKLSILAALVIGLASVGASFGLRKMYVKALLKIFEYATNIKQEKLKDYEELIDNELETQMERHEKIKKMQRLRLDTFRLDSADKQLLDDSDKQNNNYIRDEKEISNKQRTLSDMKRDFQLDDITDFVHQGLQSIIDDQVTKRFTTEELTVWNLLSRNDQQYEYISFRVTILWLFGFILRYCVLFPFRLVLFIFACSFTFLSTFLIGRIREGKFKCWLNWYATLILHRILSRVFSAIITFHNREHKAKCGSICVANHTSPIDVIILSTDNCYSMIGQQHGGFTGMMQKAFSRSARHIWFDRSETKDRTLVAKRMDEHVKDKSNMPILIFPEGTCINNTSVMMFKKGCFEIDTVIYPVAIKYDPRFGDAFWNSSKHTMLQYLMLMMTSWAIVVDVYYLPPMTKYPLEDAASFAKRVKQVIAKKGGFVDLEWDGMLKRASPKLDLMYEQQENYSKHLKIN
ncbi:unnamed protein product [Brachionus calyciflorus]|uniref:Phospholipid/glycerol acyltransferase domain-containing protein n=1 Tax=Brachionus calyciflorus TaxID=104777 RepID=A0A813N5S4_9BILA|nr:unnamed protein product [Brachionus calyciflorus]